MTATTGKVLPGRAKGLDLSDRGVAQASSLAARLAESRGVIGAVYSSPMERARQTATPIARAVGLRVQIRQGLNECDFGKWTGMRLDRLSKLPEWKVVQSAPSRFRFPDGESFLEMQQRICDAVEQLVARHRGESIVVVSHADPIKALVASAVGTPLDLFQRISIDPCSVSEIVFGTLAPTVLSMNTQQPGGSAQS